MPTDAIVIGRVDTVGAPAVGWAPVIADAQRKARKRVDDALVIRNIGSHVPSVDSTGTPTVRKCRYGGCVIFSGW